MSENIAWAIRAKSQGLPYDVVEGYNLHELVPSTVGEETPPPPELYEPDQNSAAGIDPATDTGQALSGNCSGRKTVGQVLSNSMEVDGTAGSDAILERDLSGVKDLLRLHGQPTHVFGENIISARLRLRELLSRNTE